LYLGDEEAHGRHCRQLLARFGQSRDPRVVADILWGALLVSDGGGGPQLFLQMADSCLKGTEQHTEYRWMVLAKGMAEYRASHFEQAIDWLRKAERLLSSPSDKAGCHLFLSMAHQRWNRRDEARAAHKQALRYMQEAFGRLDRSQPERGPWFGWIWCQVVRREAEALLEGKPAEPKP
jgi:hypothetical protein